ncbi:MAG: type IV pilus twitching motility protein PilT [Anaerolineae bacterium]
MNLETLIQAMQTHAASDLHLKAGQPPILRINGRLTPLAGQPTLNDAQMEMMIQALTTAEQRQQLKREKDLDFGITFNGQIRLRVNLAWQRDRPVGALRLLRTTVPTIDELQLPAICKTLAELEQGLVLITGPTGSGKSTTLAAMLEHINRTMARHVVTVEDPIEYVFEERRSLFTQREVGADTLSFHTALKHALRQDPDVIMVGEMRDLETISATLTAAETGHLVMATLHTPNAPETVDRVVDVFPAHQQTQIRTQLAMTLAGVIAQRLVLRADRPGRVAACEIMLGTSAVRNLIREAKTPQMRSVIQTSRNRGMQTLEDALKDLYHAQIIDAEVVQQYTGETFQR